jgi:molybdate transport system permease protein
MDSLSRVDFSPLLLTFELAFTSTVLLVIVATPIAYWLAFSRSRWVSVVESVTALPLVLPPTVLGFYLLLVLGPEGPIGGSWEALGGDRLVFSFSGLVLGSVVYSMPFVVQPIANAFRAVDPVLLDAAASLGASRFDRIRTVLLPLARPGFLTGATVGFAHTVGEFGVVLMIGGNIPNKTRVVAIAVYDHVEALEYAQAHVLSAILVAFSFTVLLSVYGLQRRFDVVRA